MFHAYSLAVLTRFGGMSLKEANALCDGTVKDAFNRQYHSYYNVYDSLWS